MLGYMSSVKTIPQKLLNMPLTLKDTEASTGIF